MKVKNINGTSANVCKCGSWLEHWKRFGGGTVPSYCSASSCTQKPEVGAHVQKDTWTDSSWYIVPLCQGHNSQTGRSLEVSATLVPANVSLTCGKTSF